jgi:hypothetical protein
MPERRLVCKDRKLGICLSHHQNAGQNLIIKIIIIIIVVVVVVV